MFDELKEEVFKKINKIEQIWGTLSFGDTSNFFMKLQQIFQIVAISWTKFECPRVFFFCRAIFFSQKICSSNYKKFQIDLKFFSVAETNFLRKKRIC